MSNLNGLLSRRDLLRVGSIGVAATALPAALFPPCNADEKSPPREGQGKAKSVIFLWMAGGVTHIDSLDPKPDAPVEVRGILGDIAPPASPARGSARPCPSWRKSPTDWPCCAASRTTRTTT